MEAVVLKAENRPKVVLKTWFSLNIKTANAVYNISMRVTPIILNTHHPTEITVLISPLELSPTEVLLRVESIADS